MKKFTCRILLVSGFLMPLLFSSCKTTDIKEPVAASEFEDSNVIIKEDLDYLTTDISYPQFKDYPGLSKRIKNSVESDWKNFKPVAEKEWTEISSLNLNSSSAYPPYEYYVESKTYKSKGIISVYLSTYSFKGGAHGQTFIKTFNYDKNTGKDVSVTDATGLTYIELSDICRTSLYKKLISENRYEIEGETVNILTEMINDGTKPMAGNFQNFTIDGNKVTIYFGQAAVAPYSYGIQEVTIKL